MMKESRILKLFSLPRITVTFLLFLVTFSYANTLYSPFVLDDIHSFIEEPNVYLQNFSSEAISKLSTTFFGKARLIPIATFAINHYLAKGQMPIYHVTNIVIHLLGILAVYWLIMSLLRTPIGSSALKGISKTWFAFSVTALWALNPVQTNVVTYIVQRMTSISALFYIVALAFYVNGRLAAGMKSRGLFYLGFGAMVLCAFLSKENSYMLPVTVLLVEWIFISPEILVKIIRRMRWYHWLVIILLLAASLPLAEHRWAGIESTGGFRPFTWEERLLTQSRVVLYYITLLLLPLPGRMNLDYDFPLSFSVLSPPTTLVAIILLCVLLAGAFYTKKKNPLIAFGILWFCINLVIESSVIPLELVFEHRLYLPSVGFFMACVGCFDLLVAFLQTKFKSREVEQVFVLVIAILISLYSIGTSVRNYAWRDSYALYSDAALKSPNKPRTQLNLGVAMGRVLGNERESIEVFKKVIELGKPKKEQYFKAVNNIVIAYYKLGESEEAITQGNKYINEAPDYVRLDGYPKLMNSLALAYSKTGQYSKAVRALVKGITIERKSMNGYLVNALTAILTEAYDQDEYRKKLELTEEDGNKFLSVNLRMARLLLELKNYEKVSDFIKAAMKIKPDSELANLLNEALQNQMQKNKKQNELMDIRNHHPYKRSAIYRISLDLSDFILENYSPLHFAVGYLLNKAKKTAQSDDPFILWYRIKWYMKTGDMEKLVKHLEDAAGLQLDFVPLLRLTGEYFERIGKWDKAVEIYAHILDIYPGEPAWLRYEKKIITYNENKKT